MTIKKKSNAGAPTKLTDNFLKAFREVVGNAENEYSSKIVALTDEDIVFLINERLPEKNRIDIRTLDRYKAKTFMDNAPDNIKQFCRLYKAILLNQKRYIMEKLDEDSNWQKHAWKLERKFSEWNLKHISETKTDININYQPLDYRNQLNSNVIDVIESGDEIKKLT